MSNISFNKLGGQCLIAGGIISFIAFFLQIFLGGPPPDNVNIFSHFANMELGGPLGDLEKPYFGSKYSKISQNFGMNLRKIFKNFLEFFEDFAKI